MADITQINNTLYNTTQIHPGNINSTSDDNGFGRIFSQALSNINETNYLKNQAEDEEVKFAMGLSDNTHDLLIAQSKANIALQYTVAVRDRFLTAYNTIMNMQI